MADLVLRARIDLLRRNLDIVHNVLADIEDRFRPRVDVPIELREHLNRALVPIGNAMNDLDRDVQPADLFDLLDQVRKAIREARRLLPVDAHDAVLDEVYDLDVQLVRTAADQDKELQDLTDSIGSASEAELWERLATIETTCEGLFAEYVDLVRGVALRQSGIALSLFKVADAVVKAVSMSVSWRSLTIPARQETGKVTAARIIRIGFPEWTIWQVPQAAHQLGMVFASQDRMRDAFDGFDQLDEAERDHVRTLIADVFATQTVGPAYACATLLTRLSPTTAAGPEGRPSRERAGVILCALRRVGEGRVAGMVARLTDEWARALSGAGFVGDAAPQRPEFESLILRVEKNLLGAGLIYGNWDSFVTTTANALRDLADGGEPTPIEKPPLDVDVRHLLNAAWVCRVPEDVGTEPVQDRAQLMTIADHVRDEAVRWSTTTGPPGSKGQDPRDQRK